MEWKWDAVRGVPRGVVLDLNDCFLSSLLSIRAQSSQTCFIRGFHITYISYVCHAWWIIIVISTATSNSHCCTRAT